MSLRIRRVSLTEDREEMIEILTRNFGEGQETRFDWRHLDNPAGEAWAWFAFDQNNATAGTVTVFPRRMWVDGKLVLCGQVGGFAVDAGYRSLGPAVMLQRTTFGPVDSGTFAFCYDCPPHDQGMSTFIRLGMHANSEIIRYALLLRSNEYVEKKLGNRIWTKPLIGAANLVIGARKLPRRLPGLEIVQLPGNFRDEFTQLDRTVGSSGVIRASRSDELLNWRYRQNPGWSDCEVLIARRQGELLGFVVTWVWDKQAYILDLFGVQLATAGPALLDATIEMCKRKKVASLHGFCSNQHDLKALFLSSGFRPRERCARVVVYGNPSSDSANILKQGFRWPFTNVEEMG